MQVNYEAIFKRFSKAKDSQQDEMFRVLGLQIRNLQTLFDMMKEHIDKREVEDNAPRYTFVDEKGKL